MPDLDPAEMFKAAGRYRLSQAIYAAAALGVADQMGEGERTAAELATSVGVDSALLRRLMRALASEGIFVETADGRFGLNDASRQLVKGSGGREMVLGWSVLPATYLAFAQLTEAIRTGGKAFKMTHGTDFHGYLAANPAAARAYDEANESTVEGFEAAASAYDFSDVGALVDVGGGTGLFLVSVLRRYPGMRGVLFDLASVIAGIAPDLIPEDIDPRLERVAGDFFRDEVPAGDVFTLQTVLRLFEDDPAVAILRNIRRAMHARSRVLVLDFVHPPGPLVAPYGLADLHAMVAYGGRDRSADEFATLFEAAGLRFTRVVPTGGLHDWLEAVPA